MKRLVDEADGLAAEVLRSAREDGPSAAARRRAALALGLAASAGAGLAEAAMGEASSGAGGASSAGAVSVAPGATAATSASAAASAAGGGTSLTLTAASASAAATASGGWAVGALVVLALSGVAGVVWLAPDSPTPTAPRVTDTPEQRGRDDLVGVPASPASAPASAPPASSSTVGPALSVGVTPASAAPGTQGPRTSPRRAPSTRPSVVAKPALVAPVLELADEVQRLDRAKTALAAGEPGAALELLDAYDRDAPMGALRPEALALRIDAVLATGDRSTAAALARTFTARYPDHHLRLRYAELAAEP